MSIPVGNIYYMLAYAFQTLAQDGYRDLATEKFQNAENLLAEILIRGLTVQIKRGLTREYHSRKDTLSMPRGKMDLAQTLKTQSVNRRRIVCQYDEFTENHILNQILKAAVHQLVYSSEVDKNRRRSLGRLLHYFGAVSLIKSNRIPWERLHFHRNNATYQMLTEICRLILEEGLSTEKEGRKRLPRFLNDERMFYLYEKFVLGYFLKHYPQFKASAAQIPWNVEGSSSPALPIMQTDIMLKYDERVLIIDTKWYSKTMQLYERWDSVTYRSAHLYQIYTPLYQNLWVISGSGKSPSV